MKSITLKDYYTNAGVQRDVKYASDLTDAIKHNSQHTVDCTNLLLIELAKDGLSPDGVNSGWRPKPVNDATPGADPNSPHVTGEAIDLGDASSKLKIWAKTNSDRILQCGFLAIEDFSITKTWLHLQTRKVLSWQKGNFIWNAINDQWVCNGSGKTVIF